VPPGAIWQGGQVKVDRLFAGIEHEIYRPVLIFVDQARQLLFFRVSPMGQVSVRAEPVDLSIRIEVLHTEHRMGSTKGDQATGESVYLLMLLKTVPVTPAGLVVLAVGIIVAALCAAKFVPSQ
jgi:hypothetical protein